MTESILHVCRECGRLHLCGRMPARGTVATRTPHPARYSPHDRWAKYRRALFDASAAAGGM